MKTIANKECNYSLHNHENFKKELDTEISDVAQKISELFVDYFKFIIDLNTRYENKIENNKP